MANYIGNPYVDDYLQGGTGNDSLKGDTGNDTLIGGRGNDTMTGDADDDVFVYSNGDGNDVITDYEENDKVRIASGTVSTITTSGNDVILTIGSGKITLKDAKDKVITYIEGGVEKGYPDVVQFDGTTAKILEGYTEDSFDTAEYEATGQTVRNIDASEVTHDISITGNKEANSIVGSAENDTIDGAAGKDVLSGGDGDDVIIGGKGNDTMSGGIGADTFVYTLGDGNDVITDYTSSDIISLKSGAVTSAVVNGDDYIFTIGSGSTKGTITVQGAATRYVQIVDRNGNGTWYPDPPPAQWSLQKNGKKITLSEGFVSDSLDVTTETELANVKDTIVTIDASAAQTDIAITANKRANYIIGSSQNDYIDGGAGADKILGGDGNDTLVGSAGNDTLTGGGSGDTFVYSSGDGDDVITDYETSDTIFIKSGTISSAVVSGSDYVFTVGKGTITVKDAANKYVHVVDKNGTDTWYPDLPPAQWSLQKNGKKITLSEGFVSDSLDVTTETELTNVKDTIVTIDASAVQTDLSITANKRANYIVGSSQNDYIDGGAGTDKILGGDGDDSLYGGAGNDTLTGGDGDDVFIYRSGDGNDIITDYEEGDTIRLASGTAKITEKGSDVIFTVGKGKITVKNGVGKAITYVQNSQDSVYGTSAEQYVVDGKTVSLTERYEGDSFNIADLDNKTVTTIDASAVGKGLTITGNGSANKITGTADDDSISGGKGADTIIGGDGADSIVGGAGKDILTGGDGADVFIWNKGDGSDRITDYDEEDTIQFSTTVKAATSGNNVIFTTADKSKITVTGGAGKTIKYIANGVEKVYPEDELNINSAKTKVTLLENYAANSFDVTSNAKTADISTLKTIDGSAVTHDIAITGNGNANYIVGGEHNDTLNGGKGNDTLVGGDGQDVFVYSKGEGKDVITDFNADEDVIQIASGKATVTTSGSDVVFKFSTSSTLTVKNAKNKDITYIDANGDEQSYPNGVITKVDPDDEDRINVTLTSDYYQGTFDATADYPANLYNINAKALNSLNIVGNDNNNMIIGAAKNNTMRGGTGNDTLQGGSGADVFIYSEGDGNDLILNFGTSDKISIESGALSGDVTVKDDTVILKIGDGRVSLQGAANKTVTVIDEDGEQSSKIYSGNTPWFMEDDTDFSAADEGLSSLVNESAASFAAEEFDVTSALTPKTTSVPVATYTDNK